MRRPSDVPLRRRWVFHLRRPCDVIGTYRETSLRRPHEVSLPGGTDNIYSNVITPNNISGNVTATILDHLPQCLIAPDIFSNSPSTKLNIFEKDWSKFDQENFILDYLSVDWGI